MEGYYRLVLEFVFLVSIRCLEALVDEKSLRNFVDFTDYHSNVTTYQTVAHRKESFYRCKIDILSPLPGYQVSEFKQN
jgi:hypothetical protein